LTPIRPTEATYRDRRDRFAAERDALTRRWNLLANLRLLAFGGAAVCVAGGLWRRSALLPLAVAGGVLLAGFVVLAVQHGEIGRRRRRAATRAEINGEALARVAREWDALPLRHGIRAEAGHPFAADLDLFGRASVMHLLDTTTTPMGEAALGRWLTEPAAADAVRERQVAVAELAPKLDWREELALRGRLRAAAPPDPEPFLAWAEGERWLARRSWLRWAAWAGPALLWLGIAAQAAGLVAGPYWIVALGFNLAISQTFGDRAHHIAGRVREQRGALLGYADQLDVLVGEDVSPQAPILRRLRESLAVAGTPATVLLRRLDRLASLLIPHDYLLYLPLQVATLWDVHLLAALERWQAAAGKRTRGWLVALGEAEALAALGALAHDNPDWAFPEVDDAADTLTASQLAHPLLGADTRVANDVAVGPPETFLLVTGSNMSGKSTLLRALGVNVVLAGAGAPVCAAACRLPPVTLWTSVRVQDSLERGVSFFMAELQRLKLVVDAARTAREDGGPRLFYLLDEILQGTNTIERQVAARRIVRHLVAQGAIGAVSTHDLGLADPTEAPTIAAAARPVHFRETVGAARGEPAMSFDYRLRPGIATSTNALRLMALVGLNVDEEGGGQKSEVRSETGSFGPLPSDF